MGKTLVQVIADEASGWRIIEDVVQGKCGMAFTTLRNIVEAAMEEGLLEEQEGQSLLTKIGN